MLHLGITIVKITNDYLRSQTATRCNQCCGKKHNETYALISSMQLENM